MPLHSGTAIFEMCEHGSHHVIPLHLEVAENPNFFLAYKKIVILKRTSLLNWPDLGGGVKKIPLPMAYLS